MTFEHFRSKHFLINSAHHLTGDVGALGDFGEKGEEGRGGFPGFKVSLQAFQTIDVIVFIFNSREEMVVEVFKEARELLESLVS